MLIVTPAKGEREELFQELHARGDFRILYAANAHEAESALWNHAIALLVAAPEVPTHAVNELLTVLERMERIRPGLPLLVIRERQAEEPPHWARRGVGVLRRPLLPGALERSVEVVLGLPKT